MKIILSSKNTFEISKNETKDFIAEMKYACREVSIFPTMERILALMAD